MGITKDLNLFLDTKYLLKSIYRSFSMLRLIIEAKTNVDFRCMSARSEKVLVSVNNLISTLPLTTIISSQCFSTG